MTDRKKPGMAFWATVALVAVVLYVASIGPASRFEGKQGGLLIEFYFAVYSPIIWIYQHAPEPVRDLIHGYVELWN